MITTNAQALAATGLAPKVNNPSTPSLPAKVVALSIKQPIADLMAPANTDVSVTRIDTGKIATAFTIPNTITVDLVADDTVAPGTLNYIFNNDIYNGATAGVSQSYSDGFNGSYIAQLAKTATNGSGILIYGFNIYGYDSTGAPSDSVVNSALPSMVFFNGYGQALPNPITLAGAQRNTQYKSGLLTVQFQFMLNALSQFSVVLAKSQKLQLVFFTQPI